MVLFVAAAVLAYKLKRARYRRRNRESIQYRRHLLQDNADNEEEEDHVDDL